VFSAKPLVHYSLLAAANQLISVDRDARYQKIPDDNTPLHKYRDTGIPRIPTGEQRTEGEQARDGEKMLKCRLPKCRMIEYWPSGNAVNADARRSHFSAFRSRGYQATRDGSEYRSRAQLRQC